MGTLRRSGSMKSIRYPDPGPLFKVLVAVAGGTLGVAGLLKLATQDGAASNVDPMFFFLTAAEVQTLGGLLEITAAYVLVGGRFSMHQKHVVLTSLTTLFCAYRYFALPLGTCACLGTYEPGWVKAASPAIATALLVFYGALGVGTGVMLAWKPSVLERSQVPS